LIPHDLPSLLAGCVADLGRFHHAIPGRIGQIEAFEKNWDSGYNSEDCDQIPDGLS